MVTYYLAQAENGRITLGRECHGSLIKAITVEDPTTHFKMVDGEIVERPLYMESYWEARREVNEAEFEYVRGEGYFARKQ